MRISIFFINLQKSTARVDHIQSEPIRLDLRLSREVAVDGKGLTFDDVTSIHNPVKGLHQMSAQEIGCFLSHRNVWKRIAEGVNGFLSNTGNNKSYTYI